jgi:alkylation response protein AidB-like acyl-CoA dehydrogenase
MMFEWSDTDLIVRDTVRRFIDKEIRPHLDGLETGEISPYPIARKLFSEFGLDALAGEAVKTMLDKQRANEAAGGPKTEKRSSGELGQLEAQASMAAVLVSELAGVSIGLLSTIGVSLGLGAATILSRGTLAQKERWLPELITLDKIAAWAITEPDSGSDAFGGMKTTVKRDGDDYILNGQKTFITNGPYADVLVVYAKLDDGSVDRRNRQVLPFVLDSGMPGLTQSKPFKKMGMMSSPTGELFFDNVRLTSDRLLGETEQHAGGDGRVSARELRCRTTRGRADGVGNHQRMPPTLRRLRQNPHPLGPEHRPVPAHPAQAGQNGNRPDQRAEHGLSNAGENAGR